MYIGPWQEYRLAKIQDDAIQRLHEEWTEQIKAQLPEGDDARIRELMQPLMAKLPTLLMAGSKRREGGAAARKAARPASSRPASTAASTHSRRDRAPSTAPEARRSQSNQETHEDSVNAMTKPALLPRAATGGKKKKKKGTGPSGGKANNALDELQKRKKMFATWLKASKDDKPDSSSPPDASTENTRLPQILSSVPDQRTGTIAPTAGDLSPLTGPTALEEEGEPNLEDSLDEDEVNNLLNWTDNLLSPGALDASLEHLDEDFDLG